MVMNTYRAKVTGLISVRTVTVMHSNALYISAAQPQSNHVRIYLDAPPTGEEAMFAAS